MYAVVDYSPAVQPLSAWQRATAMIKAGRDAEIRRLSPASAGAVLIKCPEKAKGGPSRFGASCAKKAARKLARAGIRAAVFPQSFPYSGIFRDYGISPPDTLPLIRIKAGELAVMAARRYFQARDICAVLWAQRPDREALLAAEVIAGYFRYPVFRCPGLEKLIRSLWDDGIPVMCSFGAEQRGLDQIHICLCPPHDEIRVPPGGRAVVINATGAPITPGEGVIIIDKAAFAPLSGRGPGGLPEGTDISLVAAAMFTCALSPAGIFTAELPD